MDPRGRAETIEVGETWLHVTADRVYSYASKSIRENEVRWHRRSDNSCPISIAGRAGFFFLNVLSGHINMNYHLPHC